MAIIRSVTVKIGADISDLQKQLGDAKKKFSKLGTDLGGIGRSLSTKLTMPILALGGAAIKMGSDLEESLNKVGVVFKENASEVQSWAKTTLKSFGIAESTALDMASLFGDMGTSMGQTTDEASRMSTNLTGLAGDLASFKNIRIDVAQTALKAIYTGETESLKNLGIVMTQANLQAFAMSQGIEKNIQDMTEAEKVNLRYAYVLNTTANAQGDFERTGGGAANQMRIFQESLKELVTSFKDQVLPTFTDILKKVNEFIQWLGGLDTQVKENIVKIGVFVAALGPLFMVLGKILTILPYLKIAFVALTGPIGIVAAAVAGLAFIIYNYVKDNEDAQERLRVIWETIKDMFSTAAEIVMMIFNDLKTRFAGIWQAMGAIVEVALDVILRFVHGAFEVMHGILEFFAGFLTGDFSRAWDGLTKIVEGVWHAIARIIENSVNGIIDVINDMLFWVNKALKMMGMNTITLFEHVKFTEDLKKKKKQPTGSYGYDPAEIAAAEAKKAASAAGGYNLSDYISGGGTGSSGGSGSSDAEKAAEKTGNALQDMVTQAVFDKLRLKMAETGSVTSADIDAVMGALEDVDGPGNYNPTYNIYTQDQSPAEIAREIEISSKSMVLGY